MKMGGSALGGDWEFAPSSNDVRNVVLVGRTGNGKSSTGNSILGTEAFKSELSSIGVTSTCELQSTLLENGLKINVIDTPGLFDSSTELELTGNEIVKCIRMAKDGIHAVLVVLSLRSRFSQEEVSVIESLTGFFGPKINDYMIVIFTGSDDLRTQTFDEYLTRCPELLKETLRKCGNRCVPFDNRTMDESKKSKQLNELLSLVDVVVYNNGGKPYTDELFAQKKKDLLAADANISVGCSKQDISEVKEQLKTIVDHPPMPSEQSPTSSDDVNKIIDEFAEEEEKDEDDVDIAALVPHTPKFLTPTAEARFKKFHGRSMIDERRIQMDVFEKHNLVAFFQDKGMLATVTTALPFVRNVVVEFYSNLQPQLSEVKSASYGRVFVRGNLYNFTPEVINRSLGTENYLGSSVVDDLDEAISFLTGGKVKKWKEQFSAAKLTSLYSVLHKIAIFNWVPSKNSTVVTRPQAQLLYRIGRGIHFNFGQLVFDTVTRFAQSNTVTSFVFPFLIFNILEEQKFAALEGDIWTGDAKFFTLRNQYLKGDRVVDLPWKNPRSESPAADVGTSVGNTGSDIVKLTKAEILAHISRLQAQKDQLTEMIDALEALLLPSGQGGESADADENEADDVAEDVVNRNDNTSDSRIESDEETEEAAAARARKGKRVAEEETTTRRSLRRRRN